MSRMRPWLPRALPILILAILACASFYYFNNGQFWSSSVTTLSNLRRLNNGAHVKLSGIVTLSDPRKKSFYLQDDSAGIAIQAPDSDAPPIPGDRITLEATISESYDERSSNKSVTLTD